MLQLRDLWFEWDLLTSAIWKLYIHTSMHAYIHKYMIHMCTICCFVHMSLMCVNICMVILTTWQYYKLHNTVEIQYNYKEMWYNKITVTRNYYLELQWIIFCCLVLFIYYLYYTDIDWDCHKIHVSRFGGLPRDLYFHKGLYFLQVRRNEGKYYPKENKTTCILTPPTLFIRPGRYLLQIWWSKLISSKFPKGNEVIA